MPTITNKGVEVAYQVHGTGTPIVLMMGLGLPGRVWQDLVDDLVAHDFMAIVADNRGTGRSDAPLPPYSMADMAQDIALILADVGVDNALVVGVSFGGMLAQHVAINHPDQVSGLLLAATTCGLFPGVFPRLETIWMLLKMVFARGRVTVDQAQKLFAHPDSARRTATLFRQWNDILDELPTPPWAMVGQLLAAALHRTGDSLDQIRVPTRVVVGDSDALIPPKNSEILARLIPDATLSVVARAGHVFIHEHPEALLNNVIALREQVDLAAG